MGNRDGLSLKALAAYEDIMGAVQRGAMSAERGIQAAYDYASGQDIGYIGTLAGTQSFAAAAAAHVPGLSKRVLDILATQDVAERHVMAHSHQTALKQAHEALDRGHKASYPASQYARLFPPSAPYTPDDDEDLDEDHGFAPRRKPKVTDSETRAAADAAHEDAWTYNGLYGADGSTYGEVRYDERAVDPRQRALRKRSNQMRASAAGDDQWISEQDFRELFGRAPKPGELDD